MPSSARPATGTIVTHVLNRSNARRLADWVGRAHRAQTREQRQAVALCIARGRPFGSRAWVRPTPARFGLESTLRPAAGRERRPRRHERDNKGS